MANYRTVMELKPYKGCSVRRIHSNGVYRYIAEKDGKEIASACSLNSLRKNIRSQLEKAQEK